MESDKVLEARIGLVAVSNGTAVVPASAESVNDFIMPNVGIDHVPTAVRAHLPVSVFSLRVLR